MHDQDRVVDDGADQDDEAEHRQHVELLPCEDVDEAEADHAADAGERHREHDHDGIEEALEERRQQQERDQDREQQIELQRAARRIELVGVAGEAQRNVGRDGARPGATGQGCRSGSSPSRRRAPCRQAA
jgi:hypothetical protein